MRTNTIREIRRGELSRAAFEAVIRYGLRKTTLEKVGSIAGVSKGVVLHHFKDKGALLEAVFRRSMRDFGQLYLPTFVIAYLIGQCAKLGYL
jgi:TetR/AcrR family transcriptional repressor of bet genes